jgi:hypothetical protein
MDLSPSRTGLLAQTLWRSPGSRAHCLLTCLDSSTTPSPAATRDLTRLADVAFPLTEKGRHPVACFRSSMILPASPLSTLRCHPSRDRRQDSRPEWIRFSFSVGLSHPLQCAGLSRRSLSLVSPGIFEYPQYQLSDEWPATFLCLRHGRSFVRFPPNTFPLEARRPDRDRESLWRIQCVCAHENCGQSHTMYAARERHWTTIMRVILATNPKLLCGDHELVWREDLMSGIEITRTAPMP